MTVPRLVCLLLVVIQVPTAYGLASDPCVATFTDFEKAAISDNPENVEALVKAIYQVNRPFPLSVRVVFHSNSNNGTNIISTDPNCTVGKEIWLWVPSPVLMFMEPTKLNRWGLYTLNYFSDWKPWRADIHVPNICNIAKDQFNFFNEFTMRVQTYAASSISGETGFLGNVLKGCGDEVETTLLNITLPNNELGLEWLTGHPEWMMVFYFTGNSLLIILVCIVCMLVLLMSKHNIERINPSDTDRHFYVIYGLIWGCVVMSALGNILLSVHTVWMMTKNLTSGDTTLFYVGIMVLVQLLLGTTTVILLAICSGWKWHFPIPSVFLCPRFLCICCLKEDLRLKATKKIVRCLSLWSLLSFIVHFACRMSFVLLALLARPSTVISSLAIYLFDAFYCIHIPAMIFTYTKTKKLSGKCSTFYGGSTCHAAVLFLLFGSLSAVAICFGLLITAANALAFYENDRNSINAVFSTVLAPVALGAITWALSRLASRWLLLLPTPPTTPPTMPPTTTPTTTPTTPPTTPPTTTPTTPPTHPLTSETTERDLLLPQQEAQT